MNSKRARLIIALFTVGVALTYFLHLNSVLVLSSPATRAGTSTTYHMTPWLVATVNNSRVVILGRPGAAGLQGDAAQQPAEGQISRFRNSNLGQRQTPETSTVVGGETRGVPSTSLFAVGNGGLEKSTQRHPTTVPPTVIPQSVGCTFPNVNPFDPNIVKISDMGLETIRCDTDFMPDLTYIDDIYLKVNNSKVKTVQDFRHCQYRNITRLPFKDNSTVFSEWSTPFKDSILLTDEHEFLQVKCTAGVKNKTVVIVSESFHSLVPSKYHLRKLYTTKLKKRQVLFKPKETLNVIMVSIDGMPRHALMRNMPRTYNFLMKNASAFDFTMHSQVADNTFPNMLALLSGNLIWETNQWWNFKQPEDAFDLIWHDFERAGYRTLYSEDNPKGAGFYWGERTFLYPQTTYWHRPVHVAMWEKEGFMRRKAKCAGSRPSSEYNLEYVTRFLDKFPQEPVACMTFIIKYTHDDARKAAFIDEHVYDFFTHLSRKGHLNRSLVMLLSDHGQRWGPIRQTYNGIVESRNPFLLLSLPDWFLKKYPDVDGNLRTNTKRLTTHFDTNQMLMDLIYFRSDVKTPLYRGKYGVSLFKEIPATRTCASAQVPASQCLCGQNIDTFIDTDSEHAHTIAAELVKAVRAKSDKEKCVYYNLDKILQVGQLSMPTASVQEKKRHHAYKLRLTVTPGGAMFEGTVHVDKEKNVYSVGENIERLNMYQGEVECLPTSHQQIFCYCKGNTKKAVEKVKTQTTP